MALRSWSAKVSTFRSRLLTPHFPRLQSEKGKQMNGINDVHSSLLGGSFGFLHSGAFRGEGGDPGSPLSLKDLINNQRNLAESPTFLSRRGIAHGVTGIILDLFFYENEQMDCGRWEMGDASV